MAKSIWLKDAEGNKLIPKTIASEIYDKDGNKEFEKYLPKENGIAIGDFTVRNTLQIGGGEETQQEAGILKLLSPEIGGVTIQMESGDAGGISPLYIRPQWGTPEYIATESWAQSTFLQAKLGFVASGTMQPVQKDASGKLYVNVTGTIAGTSELAQKLNCGTVGSTTKPVYFNNGIPAECSFTLGASVPEGAKFTDTNYYHTPSATSGIKIATGTGVNDLYVPVATSAAYGTIKIGFTQNANKIPLKLENGKAYVEIPKADPVTYGGIKLGYAGTGRNFAVQTNTDGQAYVYVPANMGNSTALAIKNTFRANIACQQAAHTSSSWNTKVTNYGSTSSSVWMNTVYEVGSAISTIYISGWASGIEYFWTNTYPTTSTTSLTTYGHGSYNAYASSGRHAKNYTEIDTTTISTTKPTNAKYLIINQRPSVTSRVTVSDKYEGFAITENGALSCTTAEVSKSLTVVGSSTIAGWSFTSSELSNGCIKISGEDNGLKYLKIHPKSSASSASIMFSFSSGTTANANGETSYDIEAILAKAKSVWGVG